MDNYTILSLFSGHKKNDQNTYVTVTGNISDFQERLKTDNKTKKDNNTDKVITWIVYVWTIGFMNNNNNEQGLNNKIKDAIHTNNLYELSKKKAIIMNQYADGSFHYKFLSETEQNNDDTIADQINEEKKQMVTEKEDIEFLNKIQNGKTYAQLVQKKDYEEIKKTYDTLKKEDFNEKSDYDHYLKPQYLSQNEITFARNYFVEIESMKNDINKVKTNIDVLNEDLNEVDNYYEQGSKGEMPSNLKNEKIKK